MSITAAIIGVTLLLIRTVLGKWIPKFAFYCLWALVLFRMIIPFSFGSQWSFISRLQTLTGYPLKLVNFQGSMEELSRLATMNYVQTATKYNPIEYKNNYTEEVFNFAAWTWASGVIILISLIIVIYYLACQPLKKAIIVKDSNVLESCKAKLRLRKKVRMFTSNRVLTPVVIGYIRPKIIIPENIDKEAIEFILLHELVHIKRRDNLWRIVSVIAACVHWFNPFTWLCLYISSKDAELACDDRVLRFLTEAERKEYAKALAELAIKQHTPLTAFGSSDVKSRVLNSINYKKVPLVMSMAAALFCIILSIILISNPIW
jgi:beta-lactamase regulating signal transducer with metallopeptidase domain